MATREYDDCVRDDLVDKRIRKSVQQRAPHPLVVTYRCVHVWVQTVKADRRVDFRDEGTESQQRAFRTSRGPLESLRAPAAESARAA